MNDTTQKQIPSLDLSFEWVKDVLDKQSHESNALDAKGNTLFTVASLILLGIGISAGILDVKEPNILSYILGGLSLISYVAAATFTFVNWSLREFKTLDNPITIREWYWDMEPKQFKMELLSHLEDAYTHNQTELNKKSQAIRVIIGATAFEVIFLVLALILTL